MLSIMETREKILAFATGEIGYKESPAGSNFTKYGAWFGLQGVAWCGIFVSWCYAMAGNRIRNGGYWNGFAGCSTFGVNFKAFKTNAPVTGDIVLFDWNMDKRFDHTGIFVRWVSPSLIETIEGNTSIGNNSNGGAVMRRVRSVAQCTFYSILNP